MKKLTYLFASAGLMLASCSAEPETFKLDDSSTLTWMGQENATHQHNGTLTFSEGSLTMQGDEVVEGTFKVDMASMKVTTEGLPSDKAGYLTTHLQGEDFFMIDKHPSIDVTVSGYADGKLSTTINVMGVELKNDIPVKLEKKEGEVTISGKFSLDVSKTKIAYLKEKNPETGAPALNPNLEFDLNLKLKK
jgi:polyisoprenoid-binding protein YceI